MHVHAVEHDLPVSGLGDWGLGEAAAVSRGVAASEAERAAFGGPGCGAPEIEGEFRCSLRICFRVSICLLEGRSSRSGVCFSGVKAPGTQASSKEEIGTPEIRTDFTLAHEIFEKRGESAVGEGSKAHA